MTADRWAAPNSSAPTASPEPPTSWRCVELWHRIDRDAGRLEVARTSYHATAELARARAHELQAAWNAGTYLPEPGAYDYVAEGPPAGIATKTHALAAIGTIRSTLTARTTSAADLELDDGDVF